MALFESSAITSNEGSAINHEFTVQALFSDCITNGEGLPVLGVSQQARGKGGVRGGELATRH